MRFIERDAHVLIVQSSRIDLVIQKLLDHLVRALVGIHPNRVKHHLVIDLIPQLLNARLKDLRQRIYLGGNLVEPLWPVVDRKHGAYIGQERLRGTDIGGGFLPSDVLFPGLHGHTEGLSPLGIGGDPDHPPGYQALMGLRGGQEGGVRPTITHGHTKTLSRT